MWFQDFIKSAFQNIVSDELKKFKDLSSNDSLKSSAPTTKTDDTLWEYDGLHSAYQGECEEILIDMQRIFYEDLQAEQTSKGEIQLFLYNFSENKKSPGH